MNNPLLDAALAYAREGIPVFPCHGFVNGRCTCSLGAPENHAKPRDAGKHPATLHGFKDATTDEKQIRTWWAENPNFNVGLRTGRVSNRVVIDIDGDDGKATLAALEKKYGALPPGLRAETGGGGWHIPLRAPEQPLQGHNDKRWGAGIDFKAEGGYVVAPPSTHMSGRPYRWMSGGGVASMPEWLQAMCVEKKPPVRIAAPATSYPPADSALLECAQRWLVRFGPTTKDGTWPDMAFRMAAQLRNTYALTLEEALPLALEWNAGCLNVHSEEEVVQILENGARHAQGTYGSGRWEADWHRKFKSRAPAEAAPPVKTTELGNAERIAYDHAHTLRYCEDRGAWLAWDGRRWARGADSRVMQSAVITVRGLVELAQRADSDDQRQRILKWAMSSESRRTLEGSISLARAQEGLIVKPEQLDADPWLLNVNTGTIDLSTGVHRPHNRADLITRLVPVDFAPEATCPLWDGLLATAFQGDQELEAFVARAFGSALTGVMKDQVLFFLHGAGANGKSTILNTFLRLMGDYGTQGAPTLLLSAEHGTHHSTQEAELEGYRFVVCTEVEAGQRMAEAAVKRLTGTDKIKAHKMHKDNVEFWATFKIFLAANDEPQIRGTDEGIWRRLQKIPFNHTIPEAQRDRDLNDKLQAELPGILNWALQGCLDWRRNGLRPPQAVQAATKAYRAEQDRTAEFLAEAVAGQPPGMPIPVSELRARYEQWCNANEIFPLTPNKFNFRMEAAGWERFFWRRGETGVKAWRRSMKTPVGW